MVIKKLVRNSVVPVRSLLAISARAMIVGRRPIAELRAQYIEAVTSNDPQAVGKLVADDYVMVPRDRRERGMNGKGNCDVYQI